MGFALWMLGWVVWREADRTTDRWERGMFRYGAVFLFVQSVVELVKSLTGVQHLYELWTP